MKKKTVQRPNRDPDHYSKRGVPYWWSPEWTRGTAADTIRDADSMKVYLSRRDVMQDFAINVNGDYVKPCPSYGRIHAVQDNSGDVNLYMKSKDGNLTYIKGSIQKEFKKWHLDRSIDYLLLGMDPDDIIKEDI